MKVNTTKANKHLQSGQTNEGKNAELEYLFDELTLKSENLRSMLIERDRKLKVLVALTELFCNKWSKKDYLDFVVKLIQKWSGCQCVGLRVLDGYGFIPYNAYTGFSDEFWESENMLSVEHDNCICIRVIKGEFEAQDNHLINARGTFYCNNLARFASSLSEDGKQRFRGKCIEAGFLSVAVIPMVHQDKTIGVIHIADKNEEMLNQHVIEFLEAVANLLGESVSRYLLEMELQKSQDSLAMLDCLLSNINEIVYVADPKTYEIVYINNTLKEMLKKDAIAAKCYKELQGLDSPCDFCTNNKILAEKGKPYRWEHHNSLLNKDFIIVDKIINWHDGRELRFEFAIDITDRKEAERKLEFMSYHDYLTGLYNRTYFEEKMNSLDMLQQTDAGIILCDLDGLKLVNDSVGHGTGDSLLVEMGRILSDSAGPDQVTARIGGDEFGILLTDVGRSDLENICSRIRYGIDDHNNTRANLMLSASIGYSARSGGFKSMRELYKEADYNMHREKLHHVMSAHSSVVQTLIRALEARDFITDGHAERLQEMAEKLGRAANLPKHRIDDLRLLARFHDIGKVGIPDNILFKQGPLGFRENNEMRRHCEIGYRIAQSSLDLMPIADWILKHHEWWNGEGYPLNLKGEEIPVECRILAIIDAYDAMTNDRPYRKALSHSEALRELKRCSGIQFDPQLTELYIRINKEYC